MKQLLYYLKSNKGSGVVSVMLAMLFLTAFGTLSLYLSYTSVKMSVAERTGMETDADAYTCMDEVRAGVQQLVSDTISETYTAVMPYYSEENENIGESFKEKFKELIISGKYYPSETDKSLKYDLFTDNATKYDITTLEKMIRENRNYDVDVYSGDQGKGFGTQGKGTVIKIDEDGNEAADSSDVNGYKLKDVSLTFTGKDGYTSTVTTDIIITCPDVGYLLTQYALKGIPNFAMVATDTIKQTIEGDAATSTDVTVTGDVYAGNVELNGDSTFKVKNYSTFICKNTVNVDGNNATFLQTIRPYYGVTYTTYSFLNNPRFEIDNTSTLWAGRIEIGSLSSAGLYGNTYVKDDLEFSGNRANVILGAHTKVSNIVNPTSRNGSYYGFGSSTTDPSQSSSIIANGEGNKLDIGGLGTLTLAGYTFISNSTRTSFDSYITDKTTTTGSTETENEKALRMGESISGKNNQMVYYTTAEKVKYREYVTESATINGVTDDYIVNNGTGSLIVGKYPNCQYYDKTTGTTNTTETYDPQLSEELTVSQEMMAVFTKKDYAKIAKFYLAGEKIKLEDGKYIIDTSNGDNGYSLSYIDDSLTEDNALYHKTFADYHAHLSPVFEVAGDSQYVVHFFLNFETVNDSNNFFIASFESNKTEIKNELISHMAMFGLDSGIASTASGTMYKDENYNDITTALTQSAEEIRKNSEFIMEIFDNYCTSLSNKKSDDSSATTPFDTYIDKQAILDFSSDETSTVVKEFYNSDDELVAVIVKGDYSYTSSSQDSICLIVATGNVTVSDDFNGLILSDKNIIIKSDADFVHFADAVISAFQAKTSDGNDSVKDYFKENITKDYKVGDSSKNESAFDIDAMVYYDNWTE